MTAIAPSLELRGICKSFGTLQALKGVDLAISKGEFFGFLGPNGAGKSTLLKVFSGFLNPDAGDILINGQVVDPDNRQARRGCGLVPQELAIYNLLTPLENLAVFGRLHGLSRKAVVERGGELLQSVGLWERRHDRVKDFSGGMKRRLNIIVSLLHGPEILLCDEPTVGVDPQSRNAIFEYLEILNREGMTILYTTHYMEEAERLCRRIAIIDHGSILGCGDQVQLLAMAGIGCEVLLRKGPDIGPLLEEARSQGKLLEEELIYRLIPSGTPRLSRLYAILEETGLGHDCIQVRQPSLEGLFLKLTGHRLRD